MAVFQPNISSFELMVVQGDKITADMILWRKYRLPLAGLRLVEVFLDLNPHLAKLHRNSPFIPVGTQVRIPIDEDLLAGRPRPVKVVNVFGEV
jgi:hypothetical protein